MALTDKLYIFTDAVADDYVLVGRLVTDNGVGTFEYAPEWLKHPSAFAVDPINLPLKAVQFSTTMNDGVFNALLDAGPDKWGRSLMTRLMERPPRSNIELLLASTGGAGALHYSGSRTPGSVRDILDQLYVDPEDLIAYLDDLEANSEKLPPFIKAAIFAGSSLGGARPKILVRTKDGIEHIAKLNKPDDSFDVSKVELSMLQFAQLNGIRVPNAEVTILSGRSALMIQRFDRVNGNSVHYISAHSLLNGHRVRLGDELKHISYAGIAEIIRKISTKPVEDCHELFRRAAVNIIVGNTDDHLKNHGFLLQGDGYRLSPAFDIVPQPNQTSLQAIGVGKGRESALDNLLAQSSAFYLSPEQASSAILNVMQTCEQLPSIMSANNVNSADQNMVMKIVREKLQTANQVQKLAASSEQTPMLQTQSDTLRP